MNAEEPNPLVQLITNLSDACKSLAASLEVLAGHDQNHGQQLKNHSAQLANQSDLNAGFAAMLSNQHVLIETLARKVGVDLDDSAPPAPSGAPN
jgi:hypothetical protein